MDYNEYVECFGLVDLVEENVSNLQKSIVCILINALIASCGSIETETPNFTLPMSSITPSPIPSVTSLPTNTYTSTPQPDITPNCKIANDTGQLYLVSDQEFRDLRTAPGELDQVLTVQYPEWANYAQIVRQDLQPLSLGKIIMSASHDEMLGIQINPAVTLVTLGVTLGWQLPSNTDLYLKAQEISTELNRLSLDWENPFDDSLRNQYPEIANSGTYAFYRYFKGDLSKLEKWCHTYVQFFGE